MISGDIVIAIYLFWIFFLQSETVMIQSAFILLFVSFSLVGFSQTPVRDAAQSKMSVAFEPNVELLGLVYFLGYEGAQSETDGYSAKNLKRYAYGIDLYKRYKLFAASRNLAVAIKYAENIWLDYFINLIVQTGDFPNARLHDQIKIDDYRRFSPTGKPDEARKNASEFLNALNALFIEVGFDSYLINSKRLYARATEQVQSGLPGDDFLLAMEAFYQGEFDSYRLVPSLTIPAGMGFGISYMVNGTKRALHVFGTFAPPTWLDSTLIDMGFGDKKHLLELSTHEFGHSFVNPAIDRLPVDAITETAKLFTPIVDAMANQGYIHWKSCLYEHFVRAGEVVITQNMGRDTDAERLRRYYIEGRKFIYLDVVLEELGKYQSSQTGTYDQAVRDTIARLFELAR
jgi:hypothetical protein